MFDPTKYPHRFSREVYLYETDAFGHLNNVSFIAYMESARFDLFKKLGLFDPKDVTTLPLILARIECDYKKIARYNDKLTIYTRIVEIRLTSFTLENIFVRERDGAIIAKGKAVLVSFDHDKNQPVPLSDEVRNKLKKYKTT